MNVVKNNPEMTRLEALKDSLTFRQRRFVEEYVVDFSAVSAALRAGYSKNYSEHRSHELIKHPVIAEYLQAVTESKQSKIVSIDPDYIIAQVVSIIGNGDTKNTDKLRGLELLARHLGMFIDRTEISGPDGEAIKMEQKIKEDVADFTTALTRLAKREENSIN